MKIKKAASIIAALNLALTLVGCVDNRGNSQSESGSTGSESSALTIIKSDKAKKTDGAATQITGPDGNPIYTSEFTQYIDKNGEPAEYSAGNLGTAICSGFAYISTPDGLCLTSIDNADIYDEDFLSFSEIPEEKLQDYVRIDVGDKVNGLTVQDAQTFFRADETGLPDNAAGKHFTGCEVSFLGELELNGYACAVKEDAYGVQAGDILFVPQGECPLPIMSFRTDRELGIHHTYYTGFNYGLAWANKYGQIFLGNTQTTDADVSCLPTDGTFVKVKALVKDIRMASTVDRIDITQASIVTINRK